MLKRSIGSVGVAQTVAVSVHPVPRDANTPAGTRGLRDGGGEAQLLRTELADRGEHRRDAAARFTDDSVQALVELRSELIADLRVDVVLAVVDDARIAERETVVLHEPEV